MKQSVYASSEQTAYADILFWGCWIGLVIMGITYLLYVCGFITPHIPLEEMSLYWSRPVSYYLEAGKVPTGWGWFGLLGSGDFLNFLGIAWLAGLSIICYVRVIPSFFRKRDVVIGAIAVLEVLVLVLAASGILGAGAH